MAAMSAKNGFRVLISGGGIAGLTLANALQHAGIDYLLLESRNVIAPQVGASIGLMPNGSRILDQLGCYEEIHAMIEPLMWGGSHYESGEYIGIKSDGPQLTAIRHGYDPAFLDRQSVLQVLYNHIIDKNKILLSKHLSSVDHSANGVIVHCADGTSYAGDVLAGADGVFSKTRQEMWRAAECEESDAIPEIDKNSMTAEYQCLFGISLPTKGCPMGHYDVTLLKDVSTMVITGKNERIYWFLFKRLDQVYKTGNIPKFTKEDAEALGELHSDINLMPNQSVRFGDLWGNRTSYRLVATEEADYKQWMWGRFVCLGDSIHKMTPNAGAGGNACVESAAALANSLKAMVDTNGLFPSMEAIKKCLLTYQKNRDERTLAVIKAANKLTRIHALRGLGDRITAHYVIPNGGDVLTDMGSELIVGATMLNYMPPPTRSLEATLPFNPEQGIGKKESLLFRAFLALPFMGLSAIAMNRMVLGPAFPVIGNMIKQGSIIWDGGSVPVLSSFYHIKWLDDLWRPITIVFASWNLDIDHIAWWQMLTFITDFGLLYSIFLVESARRANLLTFAQIPLLIGLAAQIRGIGVVGHFYFFLHYISSQISNFKASDNRLTDLSYTGSILPTMITSYYIPHFLSHFHPSLVTRHNWNWIWQMFPIWAALIQQLLKRTIMPNTIQYDRLYSPTRDWSTIRFTIGASAALSAAVWLYTLTMSPYSPLTIFVPQLTAPEHDWMDILRNFIQYDHIFCFGGALLWLAYLFNDLKHAGMVQQSWFKIVIMAAVTTLALGPGVAVGLGWLWREDVLVHKRHRAAVVKGWKSDEEKTVNGKIANGYAEKANSVANGHIEKVNGAVKH